MSRIASDVCRAVLAGGEFDHYYSADLYYAGERRIPNVPVTKVRFDEDGSAQVQQSGSCTVVWQDDYGTSITPDSAQGVLAPFGAEIYLYSTIVAGPFIEKVPLGQFRITNVPSAQDEEMLFKGQYITTGSMVDVEFKERLQRVQQDRFDAPSAPTDLTSVWAEIGRQTGLQITRNIADALIPRAVAYQEDRLKAVYDLANVLDATLHMTADGALSMRPNAWPAPIDALYRGDRGTIVSVGKGMATDGVYNRVAVRSTTDGGTAILATAAKTDGPLRAVNADGSRSPWGAVTEFVDSQYVTDTTTALQYAQRELGRVAVIGRRTVPIVETFNPLRERGDVITVERAKKVITGRIKSIERDTGPTQTMQVVING
ncbi:hypothetical protein ACFVU2_21060 [Leifsonia sp. NPDC058194]|uniref:hypothetical protein n=1 Tax=Leifsonia sp. NPDC058194 TaxID=3346374 RepID=UPI0036D906C0